MESIIQFKFCGHITIIKKTLLFQLFRKRQIGNQSHQWLHGAYNPSPDNSVDKYIFNHLLSRWLPATIYFQLISGQNVEIKAILRNLYN